MTRRESTLWVVHGLLGENANICGFAFKASCCSSLLVREAYKRSYIWSFKLEFPHSSRTWEVTFTSVYSIVQDAVLIGSASHPMFEPTAYSIPSSTWRLAACHMGRVHVT